MSETGAAAAPSSSGAGGDDEGPVKGLKSTGLEAVPGNGVPDGVEPDECCICLEELEVEGSLDGCTHRFCHGCILQWAEVSPSGLP